MTEYCSATDVRNRLTSAGYTALIDDDLDDGASSSEVAAHVTTAIQWAGGKIDSYIQDRVAIATARASGNTWLRDRCIDFAAYRMVSNGGRDVPASFESDYTDAKDLLERVRDDGDGIPGLTISAADWKDGPQHPFEEVVEGCT